MYLPALPRLARDLGATASQAQLTLTACLVGLAFGQLLAGTLSDRFGRRRPLLAGIGLFAVASGACALAPSVLALIALRAVQGFTGAAGIAISRAVVRDLYDGAAAARVFSTLMLVTGVAPIAGPVLGGWLLSVTSWRGVFVMIALAGACLFALASVELRETLAPVDRRVGGLRPVAATLGSLLADRAFVAYALACSLMMGAVFAYVAGSPFVFETMLGLSPQQFSLVFAVNSIGLVTGSLLNGPLGGRVPPRALLLGGLLTAATAG